MFSIAMSPALYVSGSSYGDTGVDGDGVDWNPDADLGDRRLGSCVMIAVGPATQPFVSGSEQSRRLAKETRSDYNKLRVAKP